MSWRVTLAVDEPAETPLSISGADKHTAGMDWRVCAGPAVSETENGPIARSSVTGPGRKS